MALDVSMILRLVDRLSGPAKRAQAAVKGLAGAQGLAGVDRAGRAASRGLGIAERAGARLGTTMARAKARVDAMAHRSLPMLNRAAEKAGAGLGSLIRRSGELAVGAAQIGVAGIGLAAGAMIGGVFSKGSQFEDFAVQLEQLEGSQAKARRSLDWIAKFAGETPYELDQVTDAFVRARGVGIDPMTGSLRMMGDAASANRKTMLDAIEAVADAQTGEFERLKEFNITSATKGNMVTFSYFDRKGKQTAKSVKKSAADIQRAILSIWDEKHSGSMARMSKTLTGIKGNLSDFASRGLLKIANAGAFDKLKSSAEKLLARLQSFEASGGLDKWANRISDKLEGLIDRADQFVSGTNWGAAADGMMAIGSAAADVLGTVAKIAAEIAWLTGKLGALDQWADGFDDKASIWMRDRGLNGLAASYEALNNMAGGSAGKTAASRDAARRRQPGNAVKPRPTNVPIGKWGSTPTWAKPSAAQPANWPKLRVGNAAPVEVKNKIELAILQPAGMQTRVNAQPGAGGSLTVTRKVNRGHAMSGAA